MTRQGYSDQDLVVRVGLGDLECLGELFVRFHQPILSFVHRMLGDAAAAENVAQEVFLRVMRHADKYNPQQAVRPWLYTIAANLCRDHRGRQGKRPASELSVDPESPVEGPLEQLATREDCARVKQAVAELPEIYREIVVMRMYEQLPYAEIAAVLEIREGTARSRMEYALHRLRKALLSPSERQALDGAPEKDKSWNSRQQAGSTEER